MAWIEVHQALLTHWKTRELAEDIGVLDLYAAAHLISLWTWALDNAPEGDLSHLRPGTVSRAAQWQGDADEFLESLVRSQWLDREGDTLRLHDWYQYAGKLIERRKEDAARKRSTRPSRRFPARRAWEAMQRRVRPAVLKRDEYTCQRCGASGIDDVIGLLEVDHVVPIARGGTNDLANLQTLCRPCNRSKGAN